MDINDENIDGVWTSRGGYWWCLDKNEDDGSVCISKRRTMVTHGYQ